MKPYWGAVANIIELLFYMIKPLHPHPWGINLVFLCDNRLQGTYTSSTDISRVIDNRELRTGGGLDACFMFEVRKYVDTLHQSPVKWSAYIFTDRSLELIRASSGACDAIGDMVDYRRKSHLPRDQFVIQFITFGGDVAKIGKSRLPPNIVDAEPADGNVLKMLMGAIYKSSSYERIA